MDLPISKIRSRVPFARLDPDGPNAFFAQVYVNSIYVYTCATRWVINSSSAGDQVHSPRA